MIASIKRKGLREFYEKGSSRKIQPNHAGRLHMMLAALESSQSIDDMGILGYGLHPLKGKMKNKWSITVSGNLCLTFEFKDGNVYLLDYEDYH